METNLSVLYKVLNIYKESLIGVLNKIDQSILQAVQHFDKQQAPINDRYELMEEMSQTLETYIHTLNTIEHVAYKLVTKYKQFENITKPGKQKPNPFEVSDLLNLNDSIDFRRIKIEKDIFQQQTSVPTAQIKNDLNQTRELEKSTCGGGPESTFKNDSSLNIDKKVPVPELRNSFSDSSTSTETLINEQIKQKVVYTVPGELSDSFSDDLSIICTKMRESSPLKTSTSDSTKTVVKSDNVNIELPENPPSTSTETVPLDICSDSISDGGFSFVTENENLNIELEKTRKLSPKKKKHNRNGKSPKQTPEKSVKKVDLTVSSKTIVKDSETTSKNESSSSTSQNQPCDAKVEKKPTFSAITKLLNMRKYDRKEEELKKFETPDVIKEVKWEVSTVKSPPNPPPRPKEKHQILDIPETVLEIDHLCTFTYIVSPSEFYVRTDQIDLDFENALNEYMNNHHQFVVNNCQDKAEARDEFGNFCCTFLPNKSSWFRLEIIDWLMDEDPNNVFVRLIDYGHQFYWDFKNFKPMPEVYSMIPKMANRCHLAAVCSPNLKFQQNWPQHSIRFLDSLTHTKKFICIYAEKDEVSYAVDFCELDDLDRVSLRDTFLKNGHGFDEHSLDEEFMGILKDLEESEAETSGEISEIVNSSSEIETSVADSTDLSNILTRNDVKGKLDLPQVGDSIKLLITGYVNVCHFYGHIIMSNKDGVYNKSFKKMKDRMKMNNSVQTYETFETNPQISELVLVKEGLEWARGSCEGFTGDEGIEVFLLDFGYKRIKKLKDLRKMKEEFLEVPFQAVECILYNCQQKEYAPLGTSRDFFDKCMHRQTFNCVVMKSSEPLEVQMFDSHSMDMRDILNLYDLIEDRE